MAYTERYANFDLATGFDNGTTEANAWKTLASMIAGCAAGDRVNIKRQATALDITANQTIQPSVAATAANPIAFRGYTSTIGDNGIWEATITTGGSVTVTFGAYCKLNGIKITAPSSSNIVVITCGTTTELNRCYFDITTTTGNSTSQITIGKAINSAFILERGRLGVAGPNGGTAHLRNCYIKRDYSVSHNGHLIQCDCYDRAFAMENCHVVGNGVAEEGLWIDRLADAAQVFISGNRFYGFENGIEIDEEPNADKEWSSITGNVFSTMTGRAINRTNTQLGYIRVAENLYHDCTSGFSNYDNFTVEDNNSALSANPFTNASAGDLSFNDTANGGAVCRARGFRMQDEYDWNNLAYKATPNVEIINTRRNSLIGR